MPSLSSREEVRRISEQIKSFATADQVNQLSAAMKSLGQPKEDIAQLRADIRNMADRVRNFATAEQIGQLSATVLQVAAAQQTQQPSAATQDDVQQVKEGISAASQDLKQVTTRIADVVSSLDNKLNSLIDRMTKLEMSVGLTYPVKNQPVLRTNIRVGYELL